MTSKSALVADFFDTLSGFADFASTADRGLAESFSPDSGLFMSESSNRRYQNKVRITLIGLKVGMLAGIVARTNDITKFFIKLA